MDALASGGGAILISEDRVFRISDAPEECVAEAPQAGLLEQFKLSDFVLHLVEQGMRSSSLHERWPHGILVTTVDDEACREAEGVNCASHRDDRIDIPFCMSPHGTTPESLRRCVRSVSYLRYKGPAPGAASGPTPCPRLTI